MSTVDRPTRRDERRAQTIREIKALAMQQVSDGGPEAVSLTGIVRAMSMSPAALYRYFDGRDALLADLVVDAYDAFADALAEVERGSGTAVEHLRAVLHRTRSWAIEHPNAYVLVFQTTIGSGKDFNVERTVAASSRSMAVLVGALADVTADAPVARDGASATREDAAATPPTDRDVVRAVSEWARRSGLEGIPVEVLALALATWTRLHGVISLELGGHLEATGIGGAVLFGAEVDTILASALTLAPVASAASD